EWLARPLRVLAVAGAALLGLALWLGWAAVFAGWAPALLEAYSPGFVPRLEPIALAAAAAITALWLLSWRLALAARWLAGGTRPGDTKEFFWLYERVRSMAANYEPVPEFSSDARRSGSCSMAS